MHKKETAKFMIFNLILINPIKSFKLNYYNLTVPILKIKHFFLHNRCRNLFQHHTRRYNIFSYNYLYFTTETNNPKIPSIQPMLADI